jgi:hypothetical protein
MTKFQVIVFLLAAMISITSCVNSKIVDPQPHIKLIDKSVTFNVYTDKDFSDARWDDAKVQIKLGIARIRQNSYEEKIEFDTTFAWIEFKDLPDALRKIQIEKMISNLNANQENISVSYSYTTSIDGYLMSAGKNDFINKLETKKVIDIQF